MPRLEEILAAGGDLTDTERVILNQMLEYDKSLAVIMDSISNSVKGAITKAIKRNEYVAAVMIVRRNAPGIGLREAKDIVDIMAGKRHAPATEKKRRIHRAKVSGTQS